MIFHLVHYWLSEANTLCSDEGATAVTDRAECDDTLPFIREMYPSSNNLDEVADVNWSSSNPFGCQFHTSTERVYFNSADTGKRNVYYRDICKEASKYRKTVPFCK